MHKFVVFPPSIRDILWDMETIHELEQAIDRIDDRLIDVLNERFALAAQLAEAKRRQGLPLADAERERRTFDRALAATPAAERDTVYGVYEKIFAGSRGVIETIARGIAIKDGQVLLCRGKGAKSSYLPGGHIEFGESGQTALVREVREELGVGSTAGALVGCIENAFDQHGKRHCEINLIYRLDLEEMSAESQEDWISFEWYPLKDLDRANLLPVALRELVRAQAE